MFVLTSNKNLIAKHRVAFPGTGFTAINGERMSDRDDTRLWDMLWRIVKNRNLIDHTVPDYEFNLNPPPPYDYRKAAVFALGRLGSWYRVPSGPHCAFSEVY